MVFEAGRGGHIFNYHRLLLPAVCSVSDDVVAVVGEEVLDSPFAKVQLRDMPTTIQWDLSVPPLARSVVRRQFAVRRTLKEALARHRPDHVYLPTVDSVSQAMGLAAAVGRRDIAPGVETEAVLHRCGFAYPTRKRRDRLFYRLGLFAHSHAPWTRLFSVDLLAYEWIQRRGGPLAARNALLPDPVEQHPPIDRAAGRRCLSLEEEGQWIGCIGTVNRRKGADLLLAAFREARLPPSTRLLLAGEHQDAIRSLLAGEYADLVRDGRVVSIDRYLEVDELYHALAALDVVCTPYARQFAIASIVLRAAAARRPVLSTHDGWCGRMVPAFELGWTCDVRDVPGHAQAIRASLERAGDWQPSEASQQLLRFHAPENFAAVFTARLRERLGLEPLPGMVPWDEVARSIHPRA